MNIPCYKFRLGIKFISFSFYIAYSSKHYTYIYLYLMILYFVKISFKFCCVFYINNKHKYIFLHITQSVRPVKKNISSARIFCSLEHLYIKMPGQHPALITFGSWETLSFVYHIYLSHLSIYPSIYLSIYLSI